MEKRKRTKSISKKRGKEITHYIVYSQIFWYLLLVAIQIALFFLFTLRFRKYTDEFLGGSIALSFFFVIYLTNTKGKNEYKIAWLLPLIIFPWFGIFAYIIYHLNAGGRYFKKSLENVKKETINLCPSKQETEKILSTHNNEKNTCNYLMNSGNYFPYVNTEIEYLKNGETYYPVLLDALKKAEHFIFMEFFIIADDESWNGILEILEEKVKEGVEVRVLYDGFGSLGIVSKKYKKLLNSKGIESKVFLKLIPFFDTKLNNRDHRKIVVIDGKIAFTGGINLANEYFNIGENRFPYWKDNGITIKGPAIRTLTTLFLQNWSIAEKPVTEDYGKYINLSYKEYEADGITIPYGDDAFNDMDIAEDLYIHIISSAKDYVHITSPYLILDNQVTEALIFAHQSGKEVSIVLPAQPDHYITFCIGRSYVKDLVDSGIKIYFYNKGFIHQKTVIGDGRTASVGSVNFDYRSFYHHFECGVYMADNSAICDIEKDFQEILKDCTLITEQEYKKIPKRQIFIGRLFRIFAPLM